MRLLLLLGFFTLYFERNTLKGAELYVSRDGTETECSQAEPCGSLYAANNKANNYDTILLMGDLNAETDQINVTRSYIIKPYTVNTNVTLPVNNVDSLGSSDSLFNISGSLIIYNVKFTIGEGENTPRCVIFNMDRNGYVRLESCSFQRDAVPIDQQPTHLSNYLIINRYDTKYVSLNLVSCLFTGITSKDSLIQGCSSGISYCEFKDITNKEGNGGVYYINNEKGYLAVVNSLFDNCVCEKGNGGAIYIKNINTLIIGRHKDNKNNTNTRFVGCKAKNPSDKKNNRDNKQSNSDLGYGGALYLTIKEMNLLNITNTDFESGEKNVADTEGNCVFVESSLLYLYWNKKNVAFMSNVNRDSVDYKFSVDDDYDDFYNLKEYYDGRFKDGANQLYIKTNGRDDNNDCSSPNNPCATIEHTLSTVVFKKKNIRIVDNIILNEDNSIEGNISSISSYKGMSVVSVDNGYIELSGDATIENLHFSLIETNISIGVIIISNGLFIKLNNILISPHGSGRIVASNVIYITTVGEISLSKCNITDIGTVLGEFPFTSPVYLEGNSISVTKCNFNNNNNNLGYGGGLNVHVYGYFEKKGEDIKYVSSKLTIKDCSFKNCSANKGGGLSISIDDIPSSLNVNKNKFEDNKAVGYDYAGSDMFVISSYLPSVVTKKTFSFLKDREDNDNTTYGYYYRRNLVDEYMNLVILVKGLRNIDKLYVGDGGRENAKCSNSGNDLCSSLEVLSDYYYYYNHSTIYIVRDLTINKNDVELGVVNYTIRGEGSEGTLAFGSDSSLEVLFSSKFISVNVRFNNDCSPISDAFINILCYESEFNNVSFISQSDNTIIEDNIFEIKSAIITFSDCLFSNLKYMDGARLFEGSKSKESNNKLEIIIKGCTFDGCSNDEYGGGLNLETGSDISIYIGDKKKATTFNNCVAPYGGAIYCNIKNVDHEIVFDRLVFGDNNRATKTHGSRILVKVSDNIELVDYSKIFSFIKNEENRTAHEYDAIVKFEKDESKQECYDIFDILNGNEKKGEKMLYVGKDGTDDNRKCTNNNTDLCGTFDYAMELVQFGIVNISVVNDFSSGKTKLNRKKVNISGENEYSKIVTSDSELFTNCISTIIRDITILINKSNSKLISSSSGSLSLFSVTFVLNSNLYNTGSFVYVEKKSNTVLDRCIMNNIVGYGDNTPIKAALEGGSLDIRGCEFINCIVNNGNGGAINVELESGSFIVGKSGDKKSVFKGCEAVYSSIYKYIIIWKEEGNYYCDNGNGGAIYICVDEVLPDKLRIGDVIFGGSNEENNKANCGDDIFITCEGVRLKDVANKDNFPYIKGMSKDYNGLMGIEEDNFDALGNIEVMNAAKMVKDSGFPIWAIILIVVVSVIIIVAVVIIIIICCCCRKKEKKGE